MEFAIFANKETTKGYFQTFDALSNINLKQEQ